MFQGRIISVDGCAKRMQPNWNAFIIDKDNDRGYSLLQADLGGVQVGSTCFISYDSAQANLRNVQIIPVEPGTTYNFSLTKPGYSLFVVQLDENNTVLVNGGWVNTGTYEVGASTKKIGFGIAVGSAHTAPITVGDCGIIITKY